MVIRLMAKFGFLRTAGFVAGLSIAGFPQVCVVPTVAFADTPDRNNSAATLEAADVQALQSLPVTTLPAATRVHVASYSALTRSSPPVDYYLTRTPCTVDGGGCLAGAASGYYWHIAPQTEWDPRWWGAYGDVRRMKTAVTIKAGSCSIGITGGTFSSNDVGKRFTATDYNNPKAADGATYNSTILSVQSVSDITVASPCPSFASVSPTMQNIAWGHDDAAALNAMFTYIASLPSTAGGHSLTTVNGAGKIYGVSSAPVSTQNANVHFHDATLLALGATNLPCATAAMFTTSGGSVVVDHVEFDSNFLPVNGFANQASGYTKFSYITAHHWEGSCQSAAVTVAGAFGSLVLTTPRGTGNVDNSWVSRGNSALGVPDRAAVVRLLGEGNASITVSKPTTRAVGSPVTFYQDASGIVNGFNGATAGGSWDHINSYEWFSGDQQVGNENDRYGYAFLCTGRCNGMTIDQFLFQYGVSEIFADKNTAGFTLIDGTMINGGFSSPEINAPNVIMAAGAKNFYAASDVAFSSGAVQIFIGDDKGPLVVISGFRQIAAGNEMFTPNALVQVWTDQVLADASRIVVDQLGSQPRMAPFTSLVGLYGPGTFSQYPNAFQYTITLKNLMTGYQNMPDGGMMSGTGCGRVGNIANGAAKVTVTLPNTIPELGSVTPPNASCQFILFPAGTGRVTLEAAAGSNLNGVPGGSIPLLQNTVYLVSSVNINSGNNQDWSVVGGISTVGPSISEGFGSSPSITAGSGPYDFSVTVGRSPGPTGSIAFPMPAPHFWGCSAHDLTTKSARVFEVEQTAHADATHATFTTFGNAGTPESPLANDEIQFHCGPY
jgi:hypothetical protein